MLTPTKPTVSFRLKHYSSQPVEGNRLTKHDDLNNVTTVYHYDIEDQETYGTRNNRLMWYAVSQNGQDVEKVYYAYHAGGHADQIIRKAAGDATYYRTYFPYDRRWRNGELMA